MKKQVVVIHGGDSYNTQEQYLETLKNKEVTLDSFLSRTDWKDALQKNLGSGYEVLIPRMPNGHNAQYEEWKIWFEKMIPFLHDGVVLVGHSLGGMFLAKYLSENHFPRKIQKVILVGAPHNNTADIGMWRLGKLEDLGKQCTEIHLFQSEDDPYVPAAEVEIFKKELPEAEVHMFKDRGHFMDIEFPELTEEIKK